MNPALRKRNCFVDLTYVRASKKLNLLFPFQVSRFSYIYHILKSQILLQAIVHCFMKVISLLEIPSSTFLVFDLTYPAHNKGWNKCKEHLSLFIDYRLKSFIVWVLLRILRQYNCNSILQLISNALIYLQSIVMFIISSTNF